MQKKKIINYILIITSFYVLFGLFLFFAQKSFIYYPNSENFDNCNGFFDYEKIYFNNTRFYLKQKNNENVIIYYHGNAGSACDRSNLKFIFEKSNYSLIFVEYAGYSNDSQKPSIDLILNDVQNINHYIVQNEYKNVTIYAESIGSAMASYHAFLGNVDNLVLINPFSRLEDVAQSKFPIYPTRFFLTEKYDNIKWLKEYNSSLLIIHAENDIVIPKKFSEDLFKNIKHANKNYIIIKNAEHNNIWQKESFQNIIIDNLKND